MTLCAAFEIGLCGVFGGGALVFVHRLYFKLVRARTRQLWTRVVRTAACHLLAVHGVPC